MTKWPPNGLELSCPAEAGYASRTLGHGGGQDKPQQRPSPPGQLQRVVSPLTLQLFKRSHRFHVVEVLVHYLKANRFIESYRRYIRYTGRDAHAVHPVRPHPPQTLE